MKKAFKRATILNSEIDDYQKLPLIDLVKRIAELGDKRALEELHKHRPIFHVADMGSVCLTVFLNHLKERATIVRTETGRIFELADKAYDLTLDKFSNLPNEPISKGACSIKYNGRLKRSGPNCRLYYQGLH